MDIDGTYTLQASPEEVWASLMDQQTLRRTIPGIERLETTVENTYAFTLLVKHAPLRGTYQGHVVVDELQFPSSYRLALEGEGQQSKLHGVWDIHLDAHNENTVIRYQGALNLGKAGALIPAPLVKGTIKVLIQQFFTALAEQLRATSRTYTAASADDYIEAEESSHNGQVAAFSQDRPTLLHAVVRQLRLGDDNPFLEEQWVIRLRRIGFISVLLLLVWVGTRLPRRLFSHQ